MAADFDRPWLWTQPPPRNGPATLSVAAVVRRYRQAAGLTQAGVAELLHIDQSYVSKIESGRRPVHDMGLLAQLATKLRIPAMELGLSDDLVRVADVSSGPSTTPVGAGTSRSMSAVAASQDQWRAGRRYLNQHRSDLARRVIDLYPGSTRLGRTPLISRTGWLPDQPVPLEDIELDWQDGPPAPRVDGTEPEALRVCPLRAPGQQYGRYTAAVRYLDPPTLFENRPSYRLLSLAWTGETGRMRFGLAAYFDKLDLSEAAGHEYAVAAMPTTPGGPDRVPDWADLPFRALIDDPFDCDRRAIVPAVTTLTIRTSPNGGTPGFLLHWRDPAKVATAGGMYDVIPAGEFQPSGVAVWDQANDFDIWRNIVRELSEELLATPEHDGSASAPIDYESWPLYRALHQARERNRLKVFCLGVGLDALTLAATILTVIVIDGQTFDDVFGDIVGVNSEGFTVAAGQSERVADGIPFTAQNVHRLLTAEPIASPGAACLHLAWRHRDTLLHAIDTTAG